MLRKSVKKNSSALFMTKLLSIDACVQMEGMYLWQVDIRRMDLLLSRAPLYIYIKETYYAAIYIYRSYAEATLLFSEQTKESDFFFSHSGCNFLIMSACTGVLPRLSCRPMVKFNQQLKYMTSAVVRQCVCVSEKAGA